MDSPACGGALNSRCRPRLRRRRRRICREWSRAAPHRRRVAGSRDRRHTDRDALRPGLVLAEQHGRGVVRHGGRRARCRGLVGLCRGREERRDQQAPTSAAYNHRAPLRWARGLRLRAWQAFFREDRRYREGPGLHGRLGPQGVVLLRRHRSLLLNAERVAGRSQAFHSTSAVSWNSVTAGANCARGAHGPAALSR